MANQREILFRGFHPCEDGGTTIYVYGKAVKGRRVEGYLFKIWEQAFILRGTTNGKPNMIEVLPSTVGQYTGLTDKNGRKIFEGDIVKEHRFCDEKSQDSIYTIGFKKQMFVAKNIDNEITVSLCTITVDSELEVIGTIWDEECGNGLD